MEKRGIILSLVFAAVSIILLSSVINANLFGDIYNSITGKEAASVGGSSVGGTGSGGGGGGGNEGGGSSGCSEGDTRKYTCSDGTEVDWCHCSGGVAWVCVGSPENACPQKTCSMPLCVGAYAIGEDSDGCKIYKCPPIAGCLEGDVKKYLCSDKHTEVDWCTCNTNAVWACINSPENFCPDSTPVEGTVEIIEPEPSCPIGCVCNQNTVVCEPREPTPEENLTITNESCPAGCVCANQTIVCEVTQLNISRECFMGCALNGACVLPGIRTTLEDKKQYCDIDSSWKEQKNNGETCDNNFECNTNLCIDSECLNSSFLQKIISWFKNLFGGD